MGSAGVEIPITIPDALLGIVLPGALAFIILAIGWFRWGKRNPPPTAHWTAPLAFAIAFLVGFINVNGGMPSFPPAESSHRLFFIVPIAMLVALVLNLQKLPGIVRAMVVVFVSGTSFYYVLAFKLNALSPLEAAMLTAVSAIAALVGWFALTQYAKSPPRVATPLALFILAGAISQVLMLSDSLSNGRCVLTLVAAAVAAILAALIFRNFSLAGPGGIFCFVLITMLLIAHTYATAGLNSIDMALLALAPIVLWLASLVPLKWRLSRRVVLQLVLLSIPLGIATVRAVIAFNHANQFSTQPGGESDL